MFGRMATTPILVAFIAGSAFAKSSHKGLEAYKRGDFQVALEDVKSDPEMKVLIVTGEGRAFCAGCLLNFFAQLRAVAT